MDFQFFNGHPVVRYLKLFYPALFYKKKSLIVLWIDATASKFSWLIHIVK